MMMMGLMHEEAVMGLQETIFVALLMQHQFDSLDEFVEVDLI